MMTAVFLKEVITSKNSYDVTTSYNSSVSGNLLSVAFNIMFNYKTRCLSSSL